MTYVNLPKLREILNSKERYRVAIGKFKKSRKNISEALSQRMAEKNIALVTLANAVNVDPGGLSRRLNGEFSLPPESLEKMSSAIFGISCHEFMFGEPGVTILPRYLSAALKRMVKLTAKRRNELLLNIIEIYNEERKEGTLPQNIPASAIIRQRIQELYQDKFVLSTYILGDDAPASVKVSLRKFSEPDSDYIGSLTTLMYYSFELDTTIDYLIVQDYTAFTEVGYRVKDGKDFVKKITDNTTLQFLGRFLRLSEQGKIKALQKLYSAFLEKENSKKN